LIDTPPSSIFITRIMSVISTNSLLAWMPDAATIYNGLTPSTTAEMDAEYRLLPNFKGMKFTWLPESHWFDGTTMSSLTSRHWEIPLIAVAVYFMTIVGLKWAVRKYGKWDVRNTAFYWNSFLSIYSWCGFFACVPVLVHTLYEHGLYFATCAPARWYGEGWCGFFVMLFIYSKIAELIDTVFLLLGGKPIIVLQWWHHSTVLLYCWHSYSVRIGTGIWFASMNYAVHSVMYTYFALTATKYRKVVAPYAIFITLFQLLQMVVGMWVTMQAVMWQASGEECSVNKTNSVLGLAMYFSYFVLFAELFVNNYLRKKKQASDAVKSKDTSPVKQKCSPPSGSTTSEAQCPKKVEAHSSDSAAILTEASNTGSPTGSTKSGSATSSPRVNSEEEEDKKTK